MRKPHTTLAATAIAVIGGGGNFAALSFAAAACSGSVGA